MNRTLFDSEDPPESPTGQPESPNEEAPGPLCSIEMFRDLAREHGTESLTVRYLARMVEARKEGIKLALGRSLQVVRGLTDWEAAALIRDGRVTMYKCRKPVRREMNIDKRPGSFPDEIITVASVTECRRLLAEEADMFRVTGSRDGRDVFRLRVDLPGEDTPPDEDPS